MSELIGTIEWINMPRTSNYEEFPIFHRKSVWVDFRLQGDQNIYQLEIQNILQEYGIRNHYYVITRLTCDEKGEPYLKDINQHYINKTTPLIDDILLHPNLRLSLEWWKNNKAPSKIGHDGLFPNDPRVTTKKK